MVQVRLRCQKGIPPALRGRAWLYLSGGKVKKEQNQGKFQVRPAPLPVRRLSSRFPGRRPVLVPLLNVLCVFPQELDNQAGDPKWVDVIEKDLHRQFPFHEMFASRGGHG